MALPGRGLIPGAVRASVSAVGPNGAGGDGDIPELPEQRSVAATSDNAEQGQPDAKGAMEQAHHKGANDTNAGRDRGTAGPRDTCWNTAKRGRRCCD